jgi:hypothetical protein
MLLVFLICATARHDHRGRNVADGGSFTPSPSMVNQAIPDVDVAANNTTQPTVSPPTTPMATGLQVLTAISEPTSTNHVGIDTTSKATL